MLNMDGCIWRCILENWDNWNHISNDDKNQDRILFAMLYCITIEIIILHLAVFKIMNEKDDKVFLDIIYSRTPNTQKVCIHQIRLYLHPAAFKMQIDSVSAHIYVLNCAPYIWRKICPTNYTCVFVTFYD